MSLRLRETRFIYSRSSTSRVLYLGRGTGAELFNPKHISSRVTKFLGVTRLARLARRRRDCARNKKIPEDENEAKIKIKKIKIKITIIIGEKSVSRDPETLMARLLPRGCSLFSSLVSWRSPPSRNFLPRGGSFLRINRTVKNQFHLAQNAK